MDHIHRDRGILDKQPRTDLNTNRFFQVEGKPRRMLIIRRIDRLVLSTAKRLKEPRDGNENIPYEIKSEVGYLVLKIQSKLPSTCPTAYLSFQMEEGKQSYICKNEPISYPAELVCQKPNDKLQKIDNDLLALIEKEVGLANLGYLYV